MEIDLKAFTSIRLDMNTCMYCRQLKILFAFQQLVKSFEVCDLPVRAARFIPRKNWVVTGSVSTACDVFTLKIKTT